MTTHWRFETDFEKIGWLTMDMPGASVNVLSREAITELEGLVGRIEEMAAAGDIVGVVLLSGKQSGFIAGADVSEFDAMIWSSKALVSGRKKGYSAVPRHVNRRAVQPAIRATLQGFDKRAPDAY